MEHTAVKSERLLQIYARLVDGELVYKQKLAEEFHVTQRSIQRDMEALRSFFAEQGLDQIIVYDRKKHGYRLEQRTGDLLSDGEVLAVCKILLESRSLRKDEMMPIVQKIMAHSVSKTENKAVKEMVADEWQHYMEPHHQKNVLDNLWAIGQAVREKRLLEIEYEYPGKGKIVSRHIEPIEILFSEYYFYLVAFLHSENSTEHVSTNDFCPVIYRIDRIRSFRLLSKHFPAHYKDQFAEQEFRKRVQFMFGGQLKRIRFKYIGPSIETVLDRLPTAKIMSQDDQGWEIEAEVFGKSVEIWLRSPGNYIIREPEIQI